MLKRNFYILSVLIVLFITPAFSDAVESFYTVQAGSHADMKAAEEQFNYLAQSLKGKDLEYLRLEKIGRYHSVRVGKFDTRAPAEALLARNRSHFETSAIMKAYYLEDRILKSLTSSAPVITPVATQEKPLEKTGMKTTTTAVSKPPEEKTAPGRDIFEAISGKVSDKKYDDAIDIIKTNLSKWPDNSELNGWSGAVYLKLNHPSEALKFFTQALALSPDVSDYPNGIGYRLFFLDKSDGAIDEFNKAVKLGPKHIDALTG
ncbi:MAG TPA: hypothetical protein ENH40_06800, partial [Nitrospirae bacterium]|nr:hypothetical protein [Nitrospirota bacterium]